MNLRLAGLRPTAASTSVARASPANTARHSAAGRAAV
jgi:hypothetical protein